jgi:hypothetical protein
VEAITVNEKRFNCFTLKREDLYFEKIKIKEEFRKM